MTCVWSPPVTGSWILVRARATRADMWSRPEHPRTSPKPRPVARPLIWRPYSVVKRKRDAVAFRDLHQLRHVLGYGERRNLLKIFLHSSRGHEHQNLAGRGSSVAEGVNVAAHGLD